MTTWDPEKYAKHCRFVSDLGAGVVELLAAKSGERILDLGCGDGALTLKLASAGCDVTGVDSSPAQVEAARRLGLKALVGKGEELGSMFEAGSFDAVFSNAALHWMKDADTVIERVARALKPAGRFVAEMGGHNCVQTIVAALVAELDRRGHDGSAANPWYFPTVEEYAGRLERRGFDVRYMALIPRPTPLPGDVMGWLTTFSGTFTGVLPEPERHDYLECVRRRLRPQLCDTDGKWTADYVRLRFDARLAQSA